MSRLKGADLGLTAAILGISAPISTIGFGLPVTTGRAAGDLHYDQYSQRQYELVSNSGTLSWVVSSGSVNTAGTPLPTFSGRIAGDHHFETSVGKDYVITGTAGTSFSDTFTGTNGTNVIGRTTETGGLVWAGSNTTIQNNRAYNGGSGYCFVNVGAGDHTIVVKSQDQYSLGTICRSSTGQVNNDGYAVTGSNSQGSVSLSLVRNGAQVGTATLANPGTDFTTTLSKVGNLITAKVVNSAGASVTMTYTDSSPLTGPYVGFYSNSGYSIDSISGGNTGNLAWNLSQPASAGASSTTGFGLPTVTGRNDGDLHFDRLSNREYTLVSAAWVATAGPTSTSQAGLPTVTNRLPGDLAFDLSTGKQYVLTGTAGTSYSDDFSGTLSASYVNVSNSGAPGSGSMAISGGRLSEGNAGVRPTGLYRSLGTGVGHSVQADVVFPASLGNLFNLGVVVKANTPLAQGDGYAFVWTGSGGSYALQRNGTQVATYTDPGGSPANSTKTMALTATTAGVVTAYLNGGQVMTYTDASPLNFQYAGVEMNDNIANDAFFDNLFLGALGTLAWSLTQPAAPQSTTGAGLPTTSGRNNGDLHYDTVGQREYVLSNGAWSVSSGAVNTVGAGLPTFIGRAPGDHHYNTTAAKDYVVTGTPGASASDTFARADGTLAGSTTEVGAKTWVNETANGAGVNSRILSGKAMKASGGGQSGINFFDTGVAGSKTVVADITMPAGAGSQLLFINATTANASTHTAYIFNFNKTSVSILRSNGGSNTVIGSTYFYGTALNAGDTATYAVSVDMSGATTAFTVTRNGVVLRTDTDASPGATATGTFVGFQVQDNTAIPGDLAALDNFAAQAFGTLAWTVSQPASDPNVMIYKSGWNSGLTYTQGQVVSRAYRLYLATATSTGVDPQTSVLVTTANIGANGTTAGSYVGNMVAQSFTVTQSITVSAIQFFVNGGSYTGGKIVGIAQALGTTPNNTTFLGSGLSSAQASGGWQTVTLNTPVVLVAGTTYWAISEETFVGTATNPTYSGVVASSTTVNYATSGSGAWTLGNAFVALFRLDGQTSVLPWQKIGITEDREAVNTVSTSGATQTIPDPNVQSLSRITLTANLTLTFPPAANQGGKSFTVVLVQDATGGRTVTWPGNIVWPGGAAPTMTATALKGDVYTFMCTDDTTGLWVGFVAGQNY